MAGGFFYASGVRGGFSAVLHDHAARRGDTADARGDSVRYCMIMRRGAGARLMRAVGIQARRRMIMRRGAGAGLRRGGDSARRGGSVLMRGGIQCRTA